MKRRWVGMAVALAGCADRPPDAPAWPGALCEARFDGAGPAATPAPAFEAPLSRVLVEVQLDTREALAEVEKAVPRRLAERRKVDIGDAGKLSYSIDRGPFAVQLSGDELAVDVQLDARAEVCKPVALLGCVGYASCAPQGKASASLRLLVSDDYRLLPSRVTIPVTRPCTMALGIDVTAEVQRQANAQAEDLKRRIDGALPELRGAVESLWKALAVTVPLGARSCARVRPEAVLQTGPRLRDGVLSIGLGIDGATRIESTCGGPQEPTAPPAPRLERDAAPGVRLQIPAVVPWADVSLAAARALAQAEPRAGRELVHVTDVQARPGPRGAQLGLSLAGRACGVLWFDATPSATRSALSFSQIAPAEGEQARASQAHRGLDLAALASWLEGRITLPLPADVSGMHRRIDALAQRLLQGDPSEGPLRHEIKVDLEPASVVGAAATADGVAALIATRGEATLRILPAKR